MPKYGLNFLSGALDNSLTFFRASTATYYNSAGVLSTATTNAPRFDYNPSTLSLNGLLIEQSSSNLVFPSVPNSSWFGLTNTVMATNNTTAPDGTATATKMQATVTSGTHVAYLIYLTTSGTTYTYSVYAKAADYNFLVIRSNAFATVNSNIGFNLSTGAVYVNGTGSSTFSAQQLPNGWWRLSVTFVASSTASNYFQLDLDATGTATGTVEPTFAGTGTSGVYVWGAQLEQVASSTSYIPTTTVAVTRAADVLSTAFVPSLTAGSFYCESIIGSLNNLPSTLNFSNSNNGFNTDGTGIGKWWNGSNNISTANSVAAGLVRKEGFSYAASARNLCLNAGAVVSDANVPFGTAQTTMYLGANVGGTQNINGWLRAVLYWNYTLTNAQLQQLTT